MTEHRLDLPLRLDAQAAAFDLFVIYDALSRVVCEMDDYDEAVKYVSAANGVEIDEVRAEVARQSQMYAEYMRNLKGNLLPVAAHDEVANAASQAQPSAQSNSEASAAAARQLLDLTRGGEEPDALDVVIRALQGSFDAGQYAFYLGRPRRSLEEIWGDSDRSFVAQIDRVELGADEEVFLVTLMQDGGISRYLGTFTTEQDALKCLGRHGKFENF